MYKLLLLVLIITSSYGAGSQRGLVYKPTKEVINATSFGDYYAVVIGNKEYENLRDLKTPINDVEAVAKVLKNEYGFKKVDVLKDATRATMLKKFNYYVRTLKSTDDFLLYYAGHGVLDAGTAYWLPVDSDKEDSTNWIISTSITTGLKKAKAKHILVVSDSCYSGTFTRDAINIRDKYIKNVISKKSRTLFASGGDEPVSDGDGKHSVFAKPFIQMLKDNNSQIITADDIFRDIRGKVAGNSSQTPEYKAIRDSGHNNGEFVFIKPKTSNPQPLTLKNKYTYYTLNITANPKNADITIDAENYIYGMRLKKGNYHIEVSKKGYITKAGDIEVSKDEDYAITLEQKNSFVKTTSSTKSKSIYHGKRSYSKNSTNTVKDNLRGLVWQKRDDGKKRDYKEAISYCKNLSLDGYNDWRLPTYNELYYLADRTKKDPAIDTNYFEARTDDWYWTITKTKWDSSDAWLVNFNNGSGYDDGMSDDYCVRCVR